VQADLLMEAPAPLVTGAAQVQAAPRSTSQGPRESFLGACPECGAGQLAFEEGCMKCHVCGYSECG